MPGRREQGRGITSRARWTAGTTALAVSGLAVAVALIPAGSADASTVKANYTAGSDKAVFTATGVEDSNCLVSTGGNTVYIKPGDQIDFSTGLAGLILDGADLTGDTIAGLNVNATIDGGTAKGGQSFTVAAGKTVKVSNLATGTHTLTWTAESLSVTGLGALGLGIVSLPPVDLESSMLKSGAKLSWTGKIFVTSNAANCTLSVQTPTTGVSVGPVHVTIPGQTVTVPGVTIPTSLPGVPRLGGSSSTPGKTSSKSASSGATYSYSPPVESVPEMVVPQGGGGAVYGGGSGYSVGAETDNGSSTALATGADTAAGAKSAASGASTDKASGSSSSPQTVGLASNQSTQSVSAQLPVLLAIIAVIALALVAGTYARLYLLGRKK